MLTGGQSRSGGSEIARPKSRFNKDLVSCWTDAGLLKSSCPFDLSLKTVSSVVKDGEECRG